MFKPNDFLSNFAKHKDFAKVSKFHVTISKPAGLVNSLEFDFNSLRFQCEAAELPGYNINTVDARLYGPATPVASFSAFNDITLTFICAGDLWEKRLFDRWMHLIVPINNYLLNYKEEYVAKINITQFYETGEPSLVVSLFNAFPITVSPLSLNWGDDGVHKLSVSFKYDYWLTNELVNNLPSSLPAETPQSSLPTGAGSNSFAPGSGKLTIAKQNQSPSQIKPFGETGYSGFGII